MPITKSFKPGDCVKLTDVTAASAKIQSMKGENAVVTKMENGRVYVVWDSPNLKAASGPFFASRFTLVSELPTPAAEAPPPAPQANPFKVDDIVVVNDTYDSLPYMVGQIGKVIHKNGELEWMPSTWGWGYLSKYEGPASALPSGEPPAIPVNGHGQFMWKYNPDSGEKTLIKPEDQPKPVVHKYKMGDKVTTVLKGHPMDGKEGEITFIHYPPTGGSPVYRVKFNDANHAYWAENQLKAYVAPAAAPPKPQFTVQPQFINEAMYIITHHPANGAALVAANHPSVHKKYVEAVAEAKKLAEKFPGATFYIMKAMDAYKGVISVEPTAVPVEV
jgi:hypothetical protein